MKVGILTFHCVDNFGAMLQAYALKTFLMNNDINAEIVRYEPFWLTGRYKLFPFVISKNIFSSIYWSFKGFKKNLSKGKNFKIQRKNMKKFRKNYFNKNNFKVLDKNQLEKLFLDTLIVGSDQIWNPKITYGLKGIYFGDFSYEKVIAYAASLGNEKLDKKYSKKFKDLLDFVDVVSLREKQSIPYVKMHTKKEVIWMPDPIFLLNEKDWEKILTPPLEKEYILLYETYEDKNLEESAIKIAKEKNLKIININPLFEDKNIISNYTSGPSEFLGYIKNASYIFTNSFHATAFSIIFNKKFLAMPSSGAIRLEDILEEFELLDKTKLESIEEKPNFNFIETKKDELLNKGGSFLLENIL